VIYILKGFMKVVCHALPCLVPGLQDFRQVCLIRVTKGIGILNTADHGSPGTELNSPKRLVFVSLFFSHLP